MSIQTTPTKHPSCAECRYCCPDDDAPGNGYIRVKDIQTDKYKRVKWTGYECRNSKSVYFRSLLNVSVHGSRLPEITWRGCEHGVRRESDDGCN